MKKNILVISGQFIPYTRSIGGIIRVLSFCNSLDKKYKVNLISTKTSLFGFFGLRKKVKNYNLLFVKKKNFFFYLIFGFVKKFFPNFAYILALDFSFAYKNEIFELAKETIKKKKIKFVLISCPPFSLFYVGNRIKNEFNNDVKIIYDYRDGWFSRFDRYNNNYFFSKLKSYFEDKVLKSSFKILCATKTIYQKITFKNKILLTNGYYSLPPENKNIKKKDIIKIGYFGLISDDPNGYRDINILFKSLNQDYFENNNFKFYFYGNNHISNKNIRNFKKFKFCKNLNYFEAQKEMQKMDYLLIIHTDKLTVKEVITGKFYEYVSTNTPIISITNGEAEVNKIINKFKLGHVINFRKKSISKEFLKILKIKKKKINFKYKNKFSRNYQNHKLMNILKD